VAAVHQNQTFFEREVAPNVQILATVDFVYDGVGEVHASLEIDEHAVKVIEQVINNSSLTTAKRVNIVAIPRCFIVPIPRRRCCFMWHHTHASKTQPLREGLNETSDEAWK
jgi:hypothetical protein